MTATNRMDCILERLRLLEEIVSEVVDDNLSIGTRMTISDELYRRCVMLRNDSMDHGGTLFCNSCNLRSDLCTCNTHRTERQCQCGNETARLREALEGIDVFGCDTLSGPINRKADMTWLRSGISEMVKSARSALDAHYGPISGKPASEHQIAALKAQIAFLIAGQRSNGERIAALEGVAK